MYMNVGFSTLNNVFGPIPAYLFIWVSFMVNGPAADAVVWLTFSKYALAPIFDECGPSTLILKLLAIKGLCEYKLLSYYMCVSYGHYYALHSFILQFVL